MRVGKYVVRPDTVGWILATIKKRGPGTKNPGEEYEADIVYPGRFDQALQQLLDRMVKDGLAEDADITKAVATVAHCYATIQGAAS